MKFCKKLHCWLSVLSSWRSLLHLKILKSSKSVTSLWANFLRPSRTKMRKFALLPCRAWSKSLDKSTSQLNSSISRSAKSQLSALKVPMKRLVRRGLSSGHPSPKRKFLALKKAALSRDTLSSAASNS